jgi:NADPH2:quinone reductase
MRAIQATSPSGYSGPRQIEQPKPRPAKDRVPACVTVAGARPLEYTVLSI